MINLLRRSSVAVFTPYMKLPGGVYILFLARIINRMGDFTNFFLTLYLTRYLNFSEKQTGLVLSLAGACMMAGAYAGGRLTDRTGRKHLLLALQSLAALSVLACGFIPDSPLVPLLLLIFTFFNGAARPVNTALLTDITRAEDRTAAFSLLYLGINIGVAAGPILAGFLFNNYRQWIFWGDALTTIITLFLILIWIREPERRDVIHDDKEAHVEGHSLKALAAIPVLAAFAPLTILTSIIYAQGSFTLPLQLLSMFGEEGPKLFGFIMSFNAAVVLVLTPLLNHLLRGISPLRRIGTGQLLYGIGFGILAIPALTAGWFFFSTLLWTAGEVLDATNSGVFIANHSPANHRGRFSSLFLIARGGGRALAPLLSGIILEAFEFSAVWLSALVLGGLLFLAMRTLDRRDRGAKKS
jgi:MFS family permease